MTPSSCLLVLCYPFSVPSLQKAIRVTTFMQRLKNSEALIDSSAETQASEEGAEGEGGGSQGTSNEGEKATNDEGLTSSSVCLQVTVENTLLGMDKEEVGCKVEGKEQDQGGSTSVRVGPSVGTSPSDIQEALCPQSQPAAELFQQHAVKTAAAEMSKKMVANLPQNNVIPEPEASPITLEKLSEALKPTININKKPTSPDPGSKHKMHEAQTTASPSAAKGKQKDEAGSWCQTQVPEGVAETMLAMAAPAASRPLGAGVDLNPSHNPRMRAEPSPASRLDREAKGCDRHSAEFIVARAEPTVLEVEKGCFGAGSSASLGRRTALSGPDMGMGASGSFSCLYNPPFVSSGGGMGVMGMYGTGLQHAAMGSASDWQMDSVIEQIEKQMAAVLEKIEGDMPSLLEQISDCPGEPPRARSAHVSPASSRAHPSRHPVGSGESVGGTPPPLPTSPRPVLPSLPHLSIPPPSYPPPSPPTQCPSQTTREQEERDGERETIHSRQSPRAGMEKSL